MCLVVCFSSIFFYSCLVAHATEQAVVMKKFQFNVLFYKKRGKFLLLHEQFDRAVWFSLNIILAPVPFSFSPFQLQFFSALVLFLNIKIHRSSHINSSTLGYTIFVVLPCACSGSNTVRFETSVMYDSATYNWPWENIGTRRSSLTFFNNWSCDLLIVMAKHSLTRNYHCVRINGSSSSRLVNRICEMMRNSLSWSPSSNLLSKHCRNTHVIIIHNLLLRPLGWSKFCSSIIRAPIFSASFNKGISASWIFYNNSVEYSDKIRSLMSAESTENNE